MIRRSGPRSWENVHRTVKTRLADLIDVYNPGPTETAQGNFGILRQAAANFEAIIQDARKNGKRVRALGSGWALSNIAITDGWLVNTKLLNGCFDVPDKYFEENYAKENRPYLVLSQCGKSIGELNFHLESARGSSLRRALKTSGIGAGQTIAGAVSGSTHGAAVRFGSTPDFIVGLQLVTGSGTSSWLERESYPVLNKEFSRRLSAVTIRNDDVFNAALVSFGSFGIISAVAIETDPIYHLEFPKVRKINQAGLHEKLRELSGIANTDLAAPYHYEFIFNPYNRKVILEASATRVAFEPGHATPAPVWNIGGGHGLAPGDLTPGIGLNLPILSAAKRLASNSNGILRTRSSAKCAARPDSSLPRRFPTLREFLSRL